MSRQRATRLGIRQRHTLPAIFGSTAQDEKEREKMECPRGNLHDRGSVPLRSNEAHFAQSGNVPSPLWRCPEWSAAIPAPPAVLFAEHPVPRSNTLRKGIGP